MTYSKARDEYLVSEILTAGPIRRVQLLYEGAIDAIAKARQALSFKDIPARAVQVNRAIEILTELAFSLDHTCGATFTGKLAELYDYAQRRLIEGNSKQLDEPLAETERLLRTLLDAWKNIPEVIEPVRNSAATSGDYMAIDYSVGDNVSVGSVLASVDQMG
jgi:flagellar protein FliS